MATIEHGVRSGVSVALTEEQEGVPGAGARVRREGDPAEGGRLRRASDPRRRRGREGARAGLMNLHVPEEYGGLGASTFEGILVGEELNWSFSGIGTSIGANGLGAGTVIIAGSDEQKAKWLPPLLDEPILCSFGLSAPRRALTSSS